MKIFISYAHVDEYRVRELVDILRDSSHDPWFDHRLEVGRAWEDQLLEAIQTCDRFLYALTPESVNSDWCQWEFAQAVHAGKPIIPVLIQDKTPLPGILGRIQYADFSKGPTPRSVAKLLGGISNAQVIDPAEVPLLEVPHAKPERPIENTTVNTPLASQLYGDAYTSFRAKDYTEALELLHDCLLIDAHHSEAQKLLVVLERHLEHDNKQAPVMTSSRPARSRVLDLLPGPFEWVDIPAGKVTLITEQGWKKNYISEGKLRTFNVPAFQIAKYPIINAQFARFIDAGGYRERRWWTEAGWQQRESVKRTEPRYWKDASLNGAEQPVVGMSWYEAIAYCQWLSEASGEVIILPTEQQWQRAAQGNEGLAYPWGNQWDSERCSNSVSPHTRNQTTSVRTYEGQGDSPFGVVDMVGNVWEWCLTGYASGNESLNETDVRVIKGGSWGNKEASSFRATYRKGGHPRDGDLVRGFRCARSIDS